MPNRIAIGVKLLIVDIRKVKYDALLFYSQVQADRGDGARCLVVREENWNKVGDHITGYKLDSTLPSFNSLVVV